MYLDSPVCFYSVYCNSSRGKLISRVSTFRIPENYVRTEREKIRDSRAFSDDAKSRKQRRVFRIRSPNYDDAPRGNICVQDLDVSEFNTS